MKSCTPLLSLLLWSWIYWFCVSCMMLSQRSAMAFRIIQGRKIIIKNSWQHLMMISSSPSSSSSSSSTSTEVVKGGARTSAAVLQANKTDTTQIEISLQPPKGTRDFYPEDQRAKNWLFGIWKDIAKKYGFEEYDAPVVESLELYIRKAGEEVAQQLYDFTDKGGRKLSLRPEMTPSLARMILARKASLQFPIKWFAIPQCWRYEKTTRGRRREHYQWNMDIFGVESVEAEAELLSAIVTSFQTMGLTAQDVGIKINSRQLLNDLMAKVNIAPEKWIATCVLIDKLDKVELSYLTKEIDELGVPYQTMEELTSLLKLSSLQEYEMLLGTNARGIQELNTIFTVLKAYGIADWFLFDPSVVRGLAYYTGIVFEGFDRSKTLRAICGGGRYDTLLQTFGSKESVPAVGFGFGDAVIMELLIMKKLLPEEQFTKPGIDILAYGMSEAYRWKLLPIVNQLRQQGGYSVEMILDNRKPKWVFQKGNRIGSQYVIIVGEDEAQKNEVTIKDLNKGEQFRCGQDQILSTLQQRKEQITK